MPRDTASVVDDTAPARLVDHNLVPETVVPGVLYEKRPARTPDGEIAEGLYNASTPTPRRW
jgi:6-oxo-cyclohex-1-ene-carbonyl-CoA hydrolase